MQRDPAATAITAMRLMVLVVCMLAGRQVLASGDPAHTHDGPEFTVSRLIKETPFNKDVVVGACYRGTRHGISLHDCGSGYGSGLWLDLDDGLSRQPQAEAFLASSFRMPALRDPPALRVQVVGRLTRSDNYVPGGTVFLATALLCFDRLPSEQPARPRPRVSTNDADLPDCHSSKR